MGRKIEFLIIAGDVFKPFPQYPVTATRPGGGK